MRCPRCQHGNRPQARLCEECGTPLTANPSGPPAPSYAEITNALSEALEQQTATAEILRVISSSPADLQPVMDAVADSAARLCGADNVVVYRREGSVLQVMAVRGLRPAVEVVLGRGHPSGRAVLDRQTVHVPDLATAGEEYPEAGPIVALTGSRAILAAPLLNKGEAIGAILLRRDEPGAFADKQVKLLETFADQAVIAIENVRLFNETNEALEQQTATAEILRVISSSPTDVQPVFDTIVESVVRLCDGVFTTVFRFDGDLIHAVAHHQSITPEGTDLFRSVYPMRPSRDSVIARSILDRTVVHVPDVEHDPTVPPASRQLARAVGYRSILGVPMLREGNPIGAIGVGRRDSVGEVRPFSNREIELLKTFADQAVIAIENVRLFNETKEALEQQTATAEILRVISSSPTDIQPVFDTIVDSALRLCDGLYSGVYRLDGDVIQLVAHNDLSPEAEAVLRREYPRPPSREGFVARAILERRVIHVSDVETDPEASEWSRSRARLLGYRSFLVVPMLREGRPIGAIRVNRGEPRAFSGKEIALFVSSRTRR